MIDFKKPVPRLLLAILVFGGGYYLYGLYEKGSFDSVIPRAVHQPSSV